MNFWNCPYRSMDKLENDGDDEQEFYCTHPDNSSCECCLDNKFGSSNEVCEFVEEEDMDDMDEEKDYDEEDNPDIADINKYKDEYDEEEE